MEKHDIIVLIKAKRGNLKIERFLNVAKVGKELLNEKNGDELATTRKGKQEPCQRSADSQRLNLSDGCMVR
ncbi:unnamed protein product [Hymenolepis diminuta]|uniref:Uncharacterized protein n=1 Tax=Hymenolepis diminuta TaxID=6216 RepID=A0A564YAY6_HYMDI|nr:unnamed protein product [Hymenolepis diminuta]